jgi:hypothetical protein
MIPPMVKQQQTHAMLKRLSGNALAVGNVDATSGDKIYFCSVK